MEVICTPVWLIWKYPISFFPKLTSQFCSDWNWGIQSICFAHYADQAQFKKTTGVSPSYLQLSQFPSKCESKTTKLGCKWVSRRTHVSRRSRTVPHVFKRIRSEPAIFFWKHVFPEVSRRSSLFDLISMNACWSIERDVGAGLDWLVDPRNHKPACLSFECFLKWTLPHQRL